MGRIKLFGFFVGQVMKESKGQAHPQKVSEILKQKLRSNLRIAGIDIGSNTSLLLIVEQTEKGFEVLVR